MEESTLQELGQETLHTHRGQAPDYLQRSNSTTKSKSKSRSTSGSDLASWGPSIHSVTSTFLGELGYLHIIEGIAPGSVIGLHLGRVLFCSAPGSVLG